MALFTETKDRKRNPLGGREAEGFDQWLRVTTQTMREDRDGLIGALSPDNPMRHVAREAARDYAAALASWEGVRGDGEDSGRDHFEVSLISAVMIAYGAAEFARSRECGPKDTTTDGRPMAAVAAEYLRACIILAKYVGVSELDVHACGGDQAELMALRADQGRREGRQMNAEYVSPDDGNDDEEAVRGCSCGMADYGAPGHDGDPNATGDDADGRSDG